MIELTQTHSRRAEQMAALSEIALELGGPQYDLDRLLDLITRRAISLLDADGGGVWLPVTADEIELTVVYDGGPGQMRGRRLKRGEGMAGKCFAAGQTFRVDDYRHWPGHNRTFGDSTFHALLNVPMAWHGQVVGVLALMHSQPGKLFSDEDERLAQLFASQAAAAVANAQFHRAARLELEERKRAEAALREREELLTRILDTVADGIYLVDRQGRMTFANSAAEKTFGVTREQLTRFSYNDPTWKITTPDGEPFPEEEQPFARVTRTGQPVYGIEQAFEHGDGTRLIVSINASPLHDANGKVIGEVASLNDITERRRAEQNLRESEARYRLLAENSTDLIARHDPDGSFLYVSPACRTLLGYEPDEMVGRSVAEFCHPDDLEEIRRARSAVLRQLDMYTFTYRFRRKNGEFAWLEATSRGVRNNGTRIVSEIVSVSRDITRRKQAEKQLRESEAKNRALLEALPDAIMLLSSNGAILDYKPAKQTAGNGHAGPTTSPQVIETIMRQAKQAQLTGETQVVEYQTRSEGGQLRDREARIVASGEDQILVVMRDITDRKNVDRMKNEFVSTVSHELRTPLTSIRGSLGLIVGGVTGDIPPQAKSLVEIAYKNSERLVLLINDILDIEKIESGKMIFHFKPLELAPLIEQAIEVNRGYAAQFGVQLALEPATTGIQVNGDSDRLTQVLTNLLSNACKFSPRDSTVQVSVAPHADNIRIAVRDHGPGIPDEFRSRIFQKFAQADSSDTRQKGGTGLGLSISKAIVEKHGGQIGFATAKGVGTTLYFDLPEWRTAPPPAAPVTARARILVCEDDADIATLLRMMLEQGGFVIDTARTAAQAKELLAANNYDGMTLDLQLPDQDGISLTRELREQERTRNLPIVVVSVTAENGKAELNGDAFRMVDWIEKPIDQRRLIAAVSEAVTRYNDHKPRFLHVEDDPDVLEVVSTILDQVAEVERVPNLRAAQQRLAEQNFDLIILDLNLPDGSGLELLPMLRDHAATPVVIFSAEEVGRDIAQQVAAALVKSRTSNEKLLETIKAFVKNGG
ncbi:MAG: PAS domain S-box protein [Chloroflexi bacterium]|nr:PAS domain S-box protein [Chloroflexota bacterium]